MSSSRDRMRRLRDLRRRGLVTKLVDVNLLALAEKFDIPDEQLNDDRELRRIPSEMSSS
jgi:hypothetical protein